VSVLSTPGTAKRYNRAKLALGIAGSGASLALPGTLVLSGAARAISAFAAGATGNAYLALLLFLLIVGSLQIAATLPIGFAAGYVVERLPRGYRPVHYRGDRYYYQGGYWYQPYGPQFVMVAPPAGLIIDSRGISGYVSAQVPIVRW